MLFPDTYEFEESATPQVILQIIATEMDKVLDELGYDKAGGVAGRAPRPVDHDRVPDREGDGCALRGAGKISRSSSEPPR